jgi:hypothetical protein
LVPPPHAVGPDDGRRQGLSRGGSAGERSLRCCALIRAAKPAIAQVNAEHVYQIAFSDITAHGMAPEQATDKAIKRVEEIFAKYPIQTT